MIRVEVLKSKKSSSRPIIKYFFFITLIIVIFTIIILKKNQIFLLYQSLLLSDDIKFIQEKDDKIKQVISRYLINKTSISKQELEFINKEIENNNNLLKYLENQNSNLTPVYYYLAWNYFYQSILAMDLSKEHILLQIQHGRFPKIYIDIQIFMIQLKDLYKYSKKYLAIAEEDTNDNIKLLNIFSEIFYFKIISKRNYKDINEIQINKLDKTLIPVYEWIMLVINTNHGDIVKIKSILENTEVYWKFSNNEKLLIYSTTYYYQKDYFNLLKTFFEYKNKNNLIFENINQFKDPSEIFIYKEFLRILMEVYYLQVNYEYSKYYLYLLEQSLKTFPSDYDTFIKKRIETIKSKIH